MVAVEMIEEARGEREVTISHALSEPLPDNATHFTPPCQGGTLRVTPPSPRQATELQTCCSTYPAMMTDFCLSFKTGRLLETIPKAQIALTSTRAPLDETEIPREPYPPEVSRGTAPYPIPLLLTFIPMKMAVDQSERERRALRREDGASG